MSCFVRSSPEPLPKELPKSVVVMEVVDHAKQQCLRTGMHALAQIANTTVPGRAPVALENQVFILATASAPNLTIPRSGRVQIDGFCFEYLPGFFHRQRRRKIQAPRH